MTSTRDRQRAAARARLEREMAERAAAATKRRQRLTIIGAGAAAALVIILVIVLIATSGGKKPAPAASGSPGASASASASAMAAGTCVWHPNPDPSASPAPSANPDLKNVGTPPASGNPAKGYRDMTINTNLGQLVVQLDLAKAPCAGASFTYLASKNFFNGSYCHRLVNKSGTDPQSGQPSDFHVLQCGDPSGTGQGGPKYEFDNEYVPVDLRPAYPAGVVAMANSGGSNTNGSQFFIVFGDTLLDANYTIFGKVTKGLDVAQKVGQAGDDGAFEPNPGGGHPKTKLTFTSVTVGDVYTSSAPASSPASASPSPSRS